MSKELTWVVQTNLLSAGDPARIQEACKALNIPFEPLEVQPFSDELPQVPTERPTVFYGSTRMVTSVARAGTWTPGVFFDEDAFSFERCKEALGAHMLNGDARIVTFEQLARETHAADKLFFVRPTDDLKAFAGTVLSFSEMQAWCRQLELEPCELPPSYPIMVAEPVGLAHEWRVFMVDGKVSSGSHYRSYDRLDVRPDLPQEVRDFATRMAAQWQPARAFALDVAATGGDYYVIEINCFNSCGFYASDVKQIVSDVSF